MDTDRTTVAAVRHRDVVPWKRQGFERTLLRRSQVTAVVHGTRVLEVTFRCGRADAERTLDDVVSVTRFPVTEVTWEQR